MSKLLYLSMFAQPKLTRAERRKARRKILTERLSKLIIYSGFITSCTIAADNPLQYAGVAGSICIALECFR